MGKGGYEQEAREKGEKRARKAETQSAADTRSKQRRSVPTKVKKEHVLDQIEKKRGKTPMVARVHQAQCKESRAKRTFRGGKVGLKTRGDRKKTCMSGFSSVVRNPSVVHCVHRRCCGTSSFLSFLVSFFVPLSFSSFLYLFFFFSFFSFLLLLLLLLSVLSCEPVVFAR